MPERKKIGIFSLNVKKLINLHLLWNTIKELHWGSLFFITCKFEAKAYPNIVVLSSRPFYALYSQQLFALIWYLEIVLYICQRSHVGNYFHTRYFSIYLFHDGISQNPKTNWSVRTTVIQLNRFCRFQIWSCWN